MQPIAIWWIGASAPLQTALETARTQTERAFGLPARLWTGAERPVDTFDARRGQHSSSAVLAWLCQQAAPALKIVAVTDVDLFVPVLTFVFGEAQLNGKAAVVSTARLGDPSTPDGARRFAARLAREIVHELGHTFGLVHCDSARCVMSRSVSIAGIDAKGGTFCTACESLLAEQLAGHTEARS